MCKYKNELDSTRIRTRLSITLPCLPETRLLGLNRIVSSLHLPRLDVQMFKYFDSALSPYRSPQKALCSVMAASRFLFSVSLYLSHGLRTLILPLRSWLYMKTFGIPLPRFHHQSKRKSSLCFPGIFEAFPPITIGMKGNWWAIVFVWYLHCWGGGLIDEKHLSFLCSIMLAMDTRLFVETIKI